LALDGFQRGYLRYTAGSQNRLALVPGPGPESGSVVCGGMALATPANVWRPVGVCGEEIGGGAVHPAPRTEVACMAGLSVPSLVTPHLASRVAPRSSLRAEQG